MKYSKIIVPVLTFTLYLVYNISIQAQSQKNWQWIKQLGGPSMDICSGVAIDSKNKLFVAGSFVDNISVNDKRVASHGNADIFLASFDVKGNLANLWNYGGKGFDQATCITVGLNNTIILGGTISDTAIFGKQKISSKGTRLFLSSTDNKGRVSWVTPIEMEGNASLFLVSTDVKGTIYAAGVFTGTLKNNNQKITSVGQNDIFLLRMTSSGTVDQMISFGSKEEDFPSSLSVDALGDITMSGTFTRPFSVGQFTVNPGIGKTNLFLLKFNSTLSPEWAKVISAEDYALISSIRSDDTNNLYVGGSFNMKLNLSDTTFLSQGFTDAFVIKYDASGIRKWAKPFGSGYYDYVTGIDIDHAGGVILTGSIGGITQIDSMYIHPSTTGDAAFIAQLDGDGNAQWGDFISGSGRNFSRGSVIDKEGNLYFCGSFQQSFKRDDGELKSKGDQDIFLARYYNCPDDNLEFGGDNVLCPGSLLELTVQNKYKTITWMDSLHNQSYYTIKKPGKYWANIVNKKGCKYSDTLNIVKALKPMYSLGNDTSVLVIDTIKLKAPIAFQNYQWMDGSSTPLFIATAKEFKASTKKYWISFTDTLNCIWSDSIAINYKDVPDIADYMHLKLVTYPNPVSSLLTWNLESDKACRLTIDMANTNGHFVYTEKVSYYAPGTEKQISMENLPNGTYIIRVKNSTTGKVLDSRSIIKQ